ncbi:NAD(P)H-flavin reductase [Candidatus Enterovibrio escicola]|uniref:NAD(P)H-flavin reductase n=1 Tax=Candidatus Enterovibrio escicola TaxID=1927127 RepID=UPI001237C727|nr:NAD(P)H-flavin reductase [Candidatus Enterovibrio escacola]
MKRSCKIDAIIPLAKSVFKVRLQPELTVNFKAGQYIKVRIASKNTPFSIANTPFDHGMLELHIGGSILDETTAAILEEFRQYLKQDKCIAIEGPFGDAWLRTSSDKPILLIAGGTGMSYISSILKSCIINGLTQPIYIYWGVKNHGLLYDHDELIELSYKNSNIQYVPVLESSQHTNLYQVGTVLDIVLRDFVCLYNYDIYISGPVSMMHVVRDVLCQKRMAQEKQMYSDAFEYL